MNLQALSDARPRTASTPPRSGPVVFLSNGLVPERDGGMVPSILGFAGGLARCRGDLSIVTPTASELTAVDVPQGVSVGQLDRPIAQVVREAGLVHLHGLWQAHTRQGARAARRHRVPYLIAAHGMAEPWALRHKALKKRVYTLLVESRNLSRSACLHALSRPEVGHLRRLAPRATVALVPNGVDLTPFDALPARAVLEADRPELVGKRILLFYGRLHVKKGLDLLAVAFQAIARDHPDAHLLLAGRDDGAWGPLRQTLESAGLASRASYLGHVGADRAPLVWAAADAFVLPSYSEGFSMAVLEAMAARRPVLMTTACHFSEADKAGAALVVEPTAPAVTSGLRTLLELSAHERQSLGDRGRDLVESSYTWDRQARRLSDVYDWILGGGPAPEAVATSRD